MELRWSGFQQCKDHLTCMFRRCSWSQKETKLDLVPTASIWPNSENPLKLILCWQKVDSYVWKFAIKMSSNLGSWFSFRRVKPVTPAVQYSFKIFFSAHEECPDQLPTSENCWKSLWQSCMHVCKHFKESSWQISTAMHKMEQQDPTGVLIIFWSATNFIFRWVQRQLSNTTEAAFSLVLSCQSSAQICDCEEQ